MLVMKFGGTSVADAGCIRRAAGIVLREPMPVVVVTSALGGVTDELIGTGRAAAQRSPADVHAALASLRRRHTEAAAGIAPPGSAQAAALENAVDMLLRELEQLLQGVHLVGECSPRSADLLVSFGERLAAPLLAAAITAAGGASEPVDARRILFTGPPPVPTVDASRSREASRALLLPLARRCIPVVTGFIASSGDGSTTTTLGRGGSDYTATLLGAFLDAREIWIWTDVDGVMTADPRVVPEARVLSEITYREAAEMAYFGSKVLHPRSMIPAVEAHIPVLIRNSFRPDEPGTRITDSAPPARLGVKSVTSVRDLALITVEGNGMIGVPGVASRIFATTAALQVNVYMVSQASSEHNVTLLVLREQGPDVVRALEAQFELEIARRQIDRVDMVAPVGIVAVIGEGMKGTPGISQRMFTALGRGRVNVLAIAQGSSELNLSAVVHAGDLQRAVGAVHSRFGLTRDTHIVLLGKGMVGRTLIHQIIEARPRLERQEGVGLKVMGVCGREEMLFAPGGIDDERLRRAAAGEALRDLGGEPRPDDAAIFERIATARWLDVVLVDVTAAENGALHADALRHGFHVVTANKKPMSGPLAQARGILAAAAEHGLSYHFETTFGAGLPALSTLQELLATGDRVDRITGCLSGTLGFLCTALQNGQPFSEAVREAMRLGYTEPDPRDDLGGVDVARKALIIARQLGADLEMSDLRLEPMLPPGFRCCGDGVERFLEQLPGADAPMAEAISAARARGEVLRYLATITPEHVGVGLRSVAVESAAGQLSGPDNLLIFQTGRYQDHPLVIRGPGAGAGVTAAGVLGDLLRIIRASS